MDPDGDLIASIAMGDQTAFGVLVDRHAGAISALASHMLGDAHMAEDITQTVFLKTWQMLPAWRKGEAKLITWMRRVATNLCLDHLRKHRPVYMDQLPEQAAGDADQEASLSSLQTRQQMQNHLLDLPDRQRAVLTLSYYQDVSLKEGASIMNLSVSAYESLLRRARTALKTRIADDKNFKRKEAP